MPMPMKHIPPKPCRVCGKLMHRRRLRSGRIEDAGCFRRRVYCDRKCMAHGQRKSAAELTRSGLLVRARRHLKSACEHCSTTQRLSIHHVDRDWRNNSPENLMTLCASCHTTLHHEAGEIVTRRRQKTCPACGRSFWRRDGRTRHCSRSCAWVTRKRKSSQPCATGSTGSEHSETPSCPPKPPTHSSSYGSER